MSSFIHRASAGRFLLSSLFFILSTLCYLSFHACSDESPIDIEKPEKTEKKLETNATGKTENVQPEEQTEPDKTEAPQEAPEADSQQQYTLQELEGKTYELEVIFHVLANSASELNEKITPQRIQDILNGVNDLYAGKSGGAEVRVRFVPAKTDSQGNRLKEEGIVRTAIAQEKMPYRTVRFDRKGGEFHKLLWDVKKYINVYIFKFEDSGVSGASTYPDMPANIPTQGLRTYYPSNLEAHTPCVVLNEAIYGSWKRGDSEGPVNQRAIYVTSHELGHYLGLYHPFRKGSDLHDYCEDTKEYDREAYERLRPELWRRYYMEEYGYSTTIKAETVRQFYTRHPIDGSASFLSYNIMDYFDTYGNRFTPDQAKRMRHCLYYAPTLPGPKIETGVSTRSLSAAPPYEPICVECGSHSH